MAIVAGLFLANSLLPHPQVWALFVLQALAIAIFSLGRPRWLARTRGSCPTIEIAAAGGADRASTARSPPSAGPPSAGC